LKDELLSQATFYNTKRRAGPTISRTRRLPRALGQGAPKIQLYGSGSDQHMSKKGMNMVKVNETRDHAVYMKV